LSEVLKLQPGIKCWGLGGEKLRSLGVETLYDISQLSTMGFAEVLKKLPFFRRVLKEATSRIEQSKPTGAILVDYPGMNFRIADHLNKLGIPFVYYILPQVWAWHQSRVEKMKRWNARFISILPFEPEFFGKRGLHVDYFGHPLIDIAKPDMSTTSFRKSIGVGVDERLIAILPGSREQEIRRILPVMLQALKLVAESGMGVRPICRPSDRAQNELCLQIASEVGSPITLHNGNLYDLLTASDLTLVTSGTATVDTAICRSPAIVLYKTSPLTYLIAKKLIKVGNIAMANLIADNTIYSELIQSEANPQRLSREIRLILSESDLATEMRSRIAIVPRLLGEGGAYKKAAAQVVSYLFR
jgi:lipid-A-disaccharide synthase